MNGLDLDDLPRRLADLADAAGPWDDPMPEIRRRAAETSTADADSGVDPDRPLGRPRTAAVRAKSRWWRSVDPFTIVSVAAVLLVVVGLGWLIHSGSIAGSSSEKAASAGSVDFGTSAAAAATTGSSAAAAGGSAGGRASASGSIRVPAPLPASGCGISRSAGAVALSAPATVRTGAVFSVHVRLARIPAGSVQTRAVFAVANGLVVGRLVPTATKIGPGVAPQADVVVTGTLRASSCGQVTPKPGPTSPRTLPGPALAPGRYQLVVVVTATRAISVSAPIAVTVTR